MIIEANQYILLTYQDLPIHQDGCRPIQWDVQGIFSDQTEIVKWMMTTAYTFKGFKIVKCKLPLLERPDHDTVSLDELTENAEVCELEDEQPETSTGP